MVISTNMMKEQWESGVIKGKRIIYWKMEIGYA